MPETSPAPSADAVETDEFFFRQPSTTDALRKLTAADELVIYCGAGVSIDRTGLSWDGLVSALFGVAFGNRPKLKVTESKAIEYLIKSLGDAKQAASILIESFGIRSKGDNAFLGSRLKEILYDREGWNAGLMLRNLTQLAMSAAGHGKKVTIVTTNYDYYIEQEFVARRDELFELGLDEADAPGMRRRVLGVDDWTVVAEAGSDAKWVEVIYLHGRVDDKANVEGQLVLTEHSYARARVAEGLALTEAFEGRHKGILTVGASLTDDPLIHALAESRDNRDSGFSLITIPDALRHVSDLTYEPTVTSGELTAATVQAALDLRGKHLGMKLLHPLSHMQSAQFLEELRICLNATVATKNPAFYETKANRVNYGQRLQTWDETWRALCGPANPVRVFRALEKNLETIQLILKKADAPAGEVLRLEAWVRYEPSTKNRSLTLWGNSAGPMVDSTLRRKESVARDSSSASVHTFLEGRPQRYYLEDLPGADTNARWKTFVSVPIYVQVEADFKQFKDSSYIPVGVVTLASLRGQKDTPTSPATYFSDDNMDMEVLREIKTAMIGVGRALFGITDVA